MNSLLLTSVGLLVRGPPSHCQPICNEPCLGACNATPASPCGVGAALTIDRAGTRATGTEGSVFHRVLDRYCGGRMGERTLALLQAGTEAL